MFTRLMLATIVVFAVHQAAKAQFTFRQGNDNGAARIGFGNSRFRVGITADQGSSISTSMSAPMVTLPANGTASFFNGTLRPFVTGLTPVVGRGAFYPSEMYQRRISNAGQRPWSTSINPDDDPQAQREEVRESRRARIIERYQQRAERELRTGRAGAAKMYYRMALKRATGETRELIVAKLAELE